MSLGWVKLLNMPKFSSSLIYIWVYVHTFTCYVNFLQTMVNKKVGRKKKLKFNIQNIFIVTKSVTNSIL
jgi:hypothetical protein